MGRKVALSIVGPDSEKPLLTVDHAKFKSGETISRFLERSGMDVYSLPVVCKVNGKYVLGAEWESRRLKGRDRVEFLARPGMGNMGGGGGGAKSIGAVVALVALTVLAPWAGGAIAGAVGLGGATLGGVAYSSIFSGIILAGGSFLISQFLKPNVGGQSTEKSSIYSISASGNAARPQQLIPVGYGRVIRAPDYAAPPYSEFEGDEMWLYQLFCIGCGEYEIESGYLDDTRMWTKSGGFHAAWAGAEMEIVRPGEKVDLFPINIVTASEVSGAEMPSPSKDEFNNGWLGPYVVNPDGTDAQEIWLDFIFPNGVSAQRQTRTHAISVPIIAEAYQVDAAGVKIGPTNVILQKSYTYDKQNQIRVTEKIKISGGGRWAVRARRESDAIKDIENFGNGKATGQDDVQWAALRAKIEGPRKFSGVTTIALKMRATANMQAVSGRRIKFVQTRKLNVWTGTQYSLLPTRNPVWAALDVWTNTDYGPALSMANVDFQTFYQYALFWDQENHYFDHFFTDRTSVAEAIETILRVGRANPSFVGDKMLMARDEEKIERLSFTDAEIVKGSLTITRRLMDEEWADGVVLEYLDERNWRPADVNSAPEGVRLQRPARVQIPGVTNRKQAVGLARHLAAVNNRRRMEVNFQVELEGRMLKRMDRILLSSELPQQWAQSLKIESYDPATRRMTFDTAPAFAGSGNHYIRIRRGNGRPWGPVQVVSTGDPLTVALFPPDLALTESQQGPIANALARTDTMDRLSAHFSVGTPQELPVLVTRGQMRGSLTTITGVVDDPIVYTVTEEGVPPVPEPNPNFEAQYPVLQGLSGSAYQRGGTMVLQVGWMPNRSAINYKIDVSSDNGASWTQIYLGSRTNCEANIGGMVTVLVRGAVVGPSGTPGNYSIVSVEVPPLRFGNGFFIMEVTPEDFIPKIRREFEFQPLIQPVALMAANTSVVAQVANERASASIKRIEEVRVGLEEAFAAYGVIVEARFDENEAYVQQQIQALSGPGGAIATLQETVRVNREDLEGLIEEIDQAQLTPDQVKALSQTEISAKIGDIGTSTVKQVMEAETNRVNGQLGQLFGRYMIKVQAGGYWAGISIEAADGTPGGGYSEIRIAANRFMIGAPDSGVGANYVFTVDTSEGYARVAMHGDLIVRGSVNASKIAVVSLSALSIDVGAVYNGFLDFAGVKIISPTWGGPRIEVWDGT